MTSTRILIHAFPLNDDDDLLTLGYKKKKSYPTLLYLLKAKIYIYIKAKIASEGKMMRKIENMGHEYKRESSHSCSCISSAARKIRTNKARRAQKP